MVAPVALLALLVIPLIARGLDVLVLGEAEAFHTGVDVERLKKICIVLISAMTGVAVSICDGSSALAIGPRPSAGRGLAEAHRSPFAKLFHCALQHCRKRTTLGVKSERKHCCTTHMNSTARG